MHRAHIGKSPAGIQYGKFLPRRATEEEQPCIFLIRICFLLFIRINIIKNSLPGCCTRQKRIDNLYGGRRVYMMIPCQNIPDPPKRQAAADGAVSWKQQPSIPFQQRMLHYIAYQGIFVYIFCDFLRSLQIIRFYFLSRFIRSCLAVSTVPDQNLHKRRCLFVLLS